MLYAFFWHPDISHSFCKRGPIRQHIVLRELYRGLSFADYFHVLFLHLVVWSQDIKHLFALKFVRRDVHVDLFLLLTFLYSLVQLSSFLYLITQPIHLEMVSSQFVPCGNEAEHELADVLEIIF